MYEISTNALNTGWSLGFGTAVPHRVYSDLDALVAHKLDTDDMPAPRPSAVRAFFKSLGARTDEFLSRLARRAAY